MIWTGVVIAIETSVGRELGRERPIATAGKKMKGAGGGGENVEKEGEDNMEDLESDRHARAANAGPTRTLARGITRNSQERRRGGRPASRTVGRVGGEDG